MRAPRLLFAILAACMTIPVGSVAVRANFDYPNMTSTTGLTLVNGATPRNSHIKVTDDTLSQKGAVWSDQRYSVASGFTTTFSLRFMATTGGADGMAFVIQNDQATALGDHAGALGYGGFLTSPTNGIPQSLAIEFDDYQNNNMNDPNSNHISVHTEGLMPNSPHENSSIGSTTNIPPLGDGVPHTFTVDYDGTTLSITMDNAATPQLSVTVDLQTILGDTQAWVGFTASTGGLAEEHRLLSWSFQSTSGSQQFDRGDVDASGSTNLQDAILSLNVLFPQGTPPTLICESAADINDDDSLNLADVVVLLSYLFVPNSPAPAAPQGSCGSDPTSGTLTCGSFPVCP